MKHAPKGMLTIKIRRIHFVGIGGVGMSGIAEILLTRGFAVSGSDMSDSATSRRLATLGATVFVGHDAANVRDADVLVYSSAIKSTNPEYQEAERLGIPIIPRAEMLAELMRMKEGIAIAGTHGKTTTTSLVAWILSEAGIDPTCLVGGRLESFDSNARPGESPFLVAEADESDGTFLKLTPVLSVITNIDPEHLDYYQSFDKLIDAFVTYANSVPFYGMNILGIDHPVVRDMLPRVTRRYTTYGFAEDADWRATDLVEEGTGASFTVWNHQKKLGTACVPLPGRHNIQNALASLVCAMELEVPFQTAADALASFSGVDRRFQVKGIVDGVTVVDDYGHHPEEIRATLQAAKGVCSGRVLALMQPHRFTRVKDLFYEFARSFNDADCVIVSDIYPASESPIPGITAETLHEAIEKIGHPNARCIPDMMAAAATAVDEAKPGDMIITLGAGDIKKAGMHALDLLGKRHGKED